MNNSLKIKIQKGSQPQMLNWIIFILPFFFGMFFDLLNFPSVLKYTLDITWVILLVIMWVNFSKGQIKIIGSYKFCFIWIVAFFIFTICAYILRYQSAFYYLWGFRNNFRFYIAFFSFVFFFRKEHIYKIISVLEILFWINTIVCLFQYYFLGLEQDYLGGIFGSSKGCNGYLNIFFVICAIKAIIFYLNKKEKLGLIIIKCGILMLLSSFAELKFFYLELLVIVAVAVLITDFSWRKFITVILVVIGVIYFTRLLGELFPEFKNVFTWEAMIESSSESGYSSEGAINRLTATTIISQRFLTTLPRKLIGLGLGNCDTSAFDFLNTPFYAQNEDLRYNWFSSAFTYLETGYIGLIFFYGFFVIVFISVLKISKKSNGNYEIYQFGAIAAICCILIGIYNSSLRVESGYMIYLIMAMPFIVRKEELEYELLE